MTAPVSLPEFDLLFSWAMCRNAMCGNFGLHYTGPAPTEQALVAHDARYRLDYNGTFRCLRCRQSFDIRINRAVRLIARYFLSLSLPFAACLNQVPRIVPEEDNAGAADSAGGGDTGDLRLGRAGSATVRLADCPNHGVNVFEHYFDRGTAKLHQLLTPLYEAFDFFTLSRTLVEEELSRLRENKF